MTANTTECTYVLLLIILTMSTTLLRQPPFFQPVGAMAPGQVYWPKHNECCGGVASLLGFPFCCRSRRWSWGFSGDTHNIVCADTFLSIGQKWQGDTLLQLGQILQRRDTIRMTLLCSLSGVFSYLSSAKQTKSATDNPKETFALDI